MLCIWFYDRLEDISKEVVKISPNSSSDVSWSEIRDLDRSIKPTNQSNVFEYAIHDSRLPENVAPWIPNAV
jgi:hypothetical protein